MPDDRCDCWKLSRPLDDDEPLPTHVCPETAIASVRNWALDQASRLGQLIRDSEQGLPGVATDSAKLADDDRAVLHQIFDELDHVIGALVSRWPVPWNELPVGMVIRQWAHEPPNAGLAKQLAADPRCQWITEDLRALHNQWIAQNKGREVEAQQEWHDRDGWSKTEPGIEDRDPSAARVLANHLAAMGLPSTPRVIKHLRAVAAGLNEPLPARGVLVTTKFHVSVDPDGKVWLRQNHTSTVEYPLTSAPLTLMDTVEDVLKRHRKFIEHPDRVFAYVDLRTIRRYQPGSFASTFVRERGEVDPAAPRFDYLRVALNEATADVKGPRADPRKVNEHLERIFHRVRKRRADSQLDTTPPHGWRDVARQELRIMQE
jgi:hypothetical protein